MGQIVTAMSSAMESLNMEKVAKVMDQFEKQFEDLDVQAAYVEGAMDTSTATSTPQEEVDGLISQVADEYGLEVSAKLDAAGYVYTRCRFRLSSYVGSNSKVSAKTPASSEQDELSQRLAKIRNV